RQCEGIDADPPGFRGSAGGLVGPALERGRDDVRDDAPYADDERDREDRAGRRAPTGGAAPSDAPADPPPAQYEPAAGAFDRARCSHRPDDHTPKRAPALRRFRQRYKVKGDDADRIPGGASAAALRVSAFRTRRIRLSAFGVTA